MSYSRYQEVFENDVRLEKSFQRIKETVLSGKTSVDNPHAVVLGGLPGAGKGTLYKIYQRLHNIRGNIVELDCDKMRKFHPDAASFSPDEFAVKTNDFVFATVDRLIAEDIAPYHFNYITESSMKSPYTAFQTAKDLKPLGYHVELAVMATDKNTAWKGTQMRYDEAKSEYEKRCAAGLTPPDCDPPRPVSKDFFDSVVRTVESSLTYIYKAENAKGEKQTPVDDIRIYTREGDLLYQMAETPNMDPTPIFSARLHNPPEIADGMIQEYKLECRRAEEQEKRKERTSKVLAKAFDKVLAKPQGHRLRAETASLDELTRSPQATNTGISREARQNRSDSAPGGRD